MERSNRKPVFLLSLISVICLFLLWTQHAELQSKTTVAESVPRSTPAPSPLGTPSLSTTSCIIPPGHFKYLHIFKKEGFTFSPANDPDVILSHGVRLTGEKYINETTFLEYVPVFVSEKSKVTELSRTNILKILKGEITDWSQMGQKPGPITLYLHGGELQKEAFQKFLETIGMTRAEVKNPNVHYALDYNELAKFASEDKEVLVIGLRTLKPEGLKTVSIDGASLLAPDTWKNYPFKVPVYIYRTDTAEGLRLSGQVIKKIADQNALKNLSPEE